MKNLVFWILALIASCLVVWQLMRARDTESLHDAALAVQHHAYAHAGRTLVWPADLAVVGNETQDPDYVGPRLVMAFSETSCDLCRDMETAFALELAEAVAPEIVTIVIGARHPRYVAAFRNSNGFDHPVLHDREGRFFAENGIVDSPILFLIDDQSRVMAAHVPMTEHLDLCAPFHQMAQRFFGVAQGHP